MSVLIKSAQAIVATTLVVAASNSLHPRRADYTCDGTNDHIELQAAIDALPAYGGKIVLLEGSYLGDDTRVLVNKVGVTIEGQARGAGVGTHLRAIPFTLSQASATLRNFSTRTTDTILLDGANYITLENLTARYGYGYVVKVTNGGYVWIRNIRFMVRGTGIEIVSPANVILIDGASIMGEADTADAKGIHVSGAAWPSTIGIRNAHFGGTAAQNHTGIYLERCDEVLIESCFLEGNRDHIYIPGASGGVHRAQEVTVRNCRLELSIDGSQRYGIYADHAHRLNIYDNDFSGGGGGEEYIHLTANVEGAEYRRNQFRVAGLISDNSVKPVAYERHSDFYVDVLAADTNHIVAAEDLTAATPITCTIAAQPDVPRNVTITITDGDTSITAFDIDVLGVDAKGDAKTENFVFAGGLSQTGNIAFATITSVTVNSITGAGVGDILDVGIGSKLGLANNIYATGEVYKVKKNNADWPAANYTVDATYDTVDVSTGGAIGGGDDFTIYYRTNLNIVT